jgi:hypothetical protein
MIEPTNRDIGRHVLYAPKHLYEMYVGLDAKWGVNHYIQTIASQFEEGRITSFNATFVFVSYLRSGIWQETSQATARQDLIWKGDTSE